MKKSISLQLDVFKEILNQNRRVAYCLMDDRVAFTMEGYAAFSIPQNQCFIDLGKVRELKSLGLYFSIADDDRIIQLTKIEANVRIGRLSKLACDNFNVWVNRTLFTKYYDGQEIYCSSPKSPIKFYSSVSNQVEAILLPVQVNDPDLL